MDEKAAFEAWLVSTSASGHTARFDVEPGQYLNRWVQAKWVAWQARASLIGQPPEGWKLVPIEPTDEMIDAFCNTPKMKVIDGMIATAQIRGGYADARLSCETKQDSAVGEGLKAALAAAPQPTVSNKIDKPD